jgi:chromate transporter
MSAGWLEMIFAFAKIGAASFGGGWTIVGIIHASVVGSGWLSQAEFADVVAIAQVTPGPVALNAATLVGFRLHGPLGAVVATASVVAVPLALSFVVAVASRAKPRDGGKLNEALKAGTIGLLAMTLWGLLPRLYESWPAAIASAFAFVALTRTKINPLWIIIGSASIGAVGRLAFG